MMKQTIYYILIPIVFLALSGIYAIKPLDKEEDLILSNVNLWWNAWKLKDSSVFVKLADENFIEFTGNHKGRLEGKRNLLKTASKVFPLLDIENIAITETKVLIHNNTALCNYYFSEQGKFGGKEFTDSGCATDVFIKKKGNWKLVSHHGTKFNKMISSN